MMQLTRQRQPAKTKRRLSTTALLIWGLVSIPAASFAHHSFAMYDSARILSLKGEVKEFEWTNPHARIWLVVPRDNQGQSDLWSVELPTSPGNLERLGWTKRSLNPGDKVVIDINPLRDGSRGGSLKKVTTSSGAVLVANPGAQTAANGAAAPKS